MEWIRPRKTGIGIDLAPLVDIIFLLLIFFMLSSSFLSPHLKLNLPEAVSQDLIEPERVVVSVDPMGRIFVNSVESSLGTLKARLREKFAAMDHRAVHIRGDEQISYGLFVRIMDLARQAGARQIHIAHRKADSESSMSRKV